MTKRRRGRGRGGKASGKQATVRKEVVMGSDVIFIPATPAGLTTVVLQPATFVRALALADSFAYYRFTHVKMTIHPNVYAAIDAQSQITAGYLPGVAPDTPPANDNSVYQLSKHAKHTLGKTVPTSMTVTASDLVGDAQIKWFKTIVGTPAAQFEVQGNFFFYVTPFGAAAGSMTTWNVTFDYVLEFQNFVVPANTPFLKLAHQSADEKKQQTIEIAGERYLRLSEDMLRALRIDN